jgi:Ca-activated chloride channel homolog
MEIPMQVATILLVCVMPAAAQQATTIRADVSLVELQVRVTDSEGHVVSGLTKDAFRLFVDDVPRDITAFQGEDAPVTAGIVIDNSASMAPKRDEVIAAALAFARASNPKDQMFVVHFNSRPRLGLPPGTPFTGSVAELETAVATFELGGTTAFYDALLLAESRFRRAFYSRKVLLSITDGGDNSSHATLAEALAGALSAGIVVYPIGVFDDNDQYRNPQVLSKIAQDTGGEAFFPKQVADITTICLRTAGEIRQQYVLAFNSGIDDGAYHRIRLTASDPKYGSLQVQTRLGYIARNPTESANSR